jgi:hypothetical protein
MPGRLIESNRQTVTVIDLHDGSVLTRLSIHLAVARL